MTLAYDNAIKAGARTEFGGVVEHLSEDETTATVKLGIGLHVERTLCLLPMASTRDCV